MAGNITAYEQPRLCNDVTVTIANGATVSSVASLLGTSLVGIVIPSNFVGSAATFLVSSDGITYQAFRNLSGTVVTAVVAASNSYGIVATDFLAWRFIKLVCDTVQTSEVTMIFQTISL